VSDVWLPESYIVRASKELNLEDFKDCECYIGVDLSATSDLTAVSYLIEKDNIYYFKTDYYLPESALRDKPDRETYKLWKQ
jgi:phage terminase